MTDSAADAVEQIVNQPEVPDGAVLRIAVGVRRQNGGEPTTELQMALVEEPEADDLLVEDAPISVEPGTAELLDDKVLDAEFDDSGVHFSVHSLAEPED